MQKGQESHESHERHEMHEMHEMPLEFHPKPAPNLRNYQSVINLPFEGSLEKEVSDGQGTFVMEHLLAKKELPMDQKFKLINKPEKSYRTKMCPHGRSCRRQFTCRFAHTENELRRPFMKRTKPCVQYQRGLCHLGAACRNYHGNMDLKVAYKYKTAICVKYAQGSCEKGDLCIFLHTKQCPVQEIIESKTIQVQNEQPVLPKPRIVQVEEQIVPREVILQDGFNLSFDFQF